MGKAKVLIADNHEVVRLGISFIVQSSNEFEVAGETGSCCDIVKKVNELRPDVLIMDARLNDGNSVDCCRRIKDNYPKAKIIILVNPNDDEAIFDSISAGANGLLLKHFNSEDLLRSIRMVLEGKSLLDPSITDKVLDKFKNGNMESKPKESLLNPQERRILGLIAEGKTNKEIAQTLMLSNNTIKNYVSNILSKLNFSNRAEAAAYAVRSNVMSYSKAVVEN